ncbi:MAG: hypothetical protein L0I24_02405 [Pseudonocardia sp.]|nr:hypothetical protein [Pseudonocardia sp.]
MTDPDLPPEDPAWGHGTLDHRGHPVHHVRGGRGRPVVCLHGRPGFRHDYRRVRPLLEDHAALGGAHLDAVARAYSRPGALRASLGWYRSGSSTVPAALASRTAPAASRTLL